MDSWSEVLPSILAIGAGLSADAVIATFGVAPAIQRRWAHWLYWTLGVSFTHCLFPMIGFSVGWVARDHGVLVRCVYLVGAVLLWHHLRRNVVRKALQPRPIESARTGSYAELTLVILAVSVDALLAGPAKSVVARQWTGAQLFVSFAAIGSIVLVLVSASATACLAAWRVATAQSRARAATARGLTAFIAGSWTVEVFVFSGFVTLALGRALLPSGVDHLTAVAAGAGLAAAIGLWSLDARRIRHYSEGIARALLAVPPAGSRPGDSPSPQ